MSFGLTSIIIYIAITTVLLHFVFGPKFVESITQSFFKGKTGMIPRLSIAATVAVILTILAYFSFGREDKKKSSKDDFNPAFPRKALTATGPRRHNIRERYTDIDNADVRENFFLK